MRWRVNDISGEKKTVAKNYGALVILQSLNYLLPLLIIPFLERRLGLEKFGLFVLSQYLMGFCVAAADFGFNVTATRQVSIIKSQNQDYSQVYFQVFWARMLLLFVVFACLCIFIFSFERFRVEWAFYLISYGAVVGQTVLPDWFFQGIENMRLLTVVNVGAKVLFTVLLFLFIQSPADYYFVPVFNSVGFLSAGIICFVISMRYVRWQGPNFKQGMEFYKESSQVFVSNIASQLSYAANGLILGFVAGDAVVGIYGAFDKLIIAAKKMYIPMYQAIYPFLARKEVKQMIKFTKGLIPVVAGIGTIGLMIVVFAGEWILDLLFEDPAIVENVLLFRWMGIIVLLAGLSLLFHSLYAPARRLFKNRMWMMIISGIFNVVLSLILVPIYGLAGTVTAFIATESILLLLATYYYLTDTREHA